MNAHTSPIGASIVPTVRYRDVSAAVEWLRTAFGLEPHRLVKDTQGSVLYGELKFGTGMVMVAPVQDSPLGKLMVQPDEIGGAETQVCYLHVDDARAHYARAKAAGAEIVLDMEVEANGGRGYSCRDLEGHVWNFGTYDPWDLQLAAPGTPRRRRSLWLACLALIVLGGAYLHEPARDMAHDLALAMSVEVSPGIDAAQAEQDGSSDRFLSEVREELSRERLARAAADADVKAIREELAQERRAREAAEIAAREARQNQTATAESGKAVKAAEAAAAEARKDTERLRAALRTASEQLAAAEKAKAAAERSAREARGEFDELRDARETAEANARRARALALRERSRRIVAERTLRKAKESPYTPYPLN
jgi:uncharacterized glyoxalase superfamily protein PhnB